MSMCKASMRAGSTGKGMWATDEVPGIVGAGFLPAAPATVEVGDHQAIDLGSHRVEEALAAPSHGEAAASGPKHAVGVQRGQDHRKLPLLPVEARRLAEL